MNIGKIVSIARWTERLKMISLGNNKMKNSRLLKVSLIFIIMCLLSACALLGKSSNARLIEPGDQIGNVTITTGVEGKFTYGFNIDCQSMTAATTYTCNVKVGDVINVSTGLVDTTGSGKLDEVWANSKYQMFINDQPVDLKAFGTIDFNHPTMGAIRFGNVVITASQPGQITVRDSGVYPNGDAFSSASTYVFSQP